MMPMTVWFKNRSLAFKFTLLSTVPVLVAAVFIAFFLIRSFERSMSESMIRHIRDDTEFAALSMSNSYVIYNKALLDKLVDNLAGDRDIRYALVEDYNDQRILSHSDHSRDGRRADSEAETDKARARPGDVYPLGNDTYLAVEPVRVDGELFGAVKVGFDLSRVRGEMGLIEMKMAGIAGLTVLFSLVIALGLSRLIGRPILALAGQAEKIAGGNLDLDIRYESGDALGKLANSFRTMAVELRNRLDQLSDNERKYRALFEGANDAVLIVNGDVIVDFNHKALELFASTRGHAGLGNLDDLFPRTQPDGSLSRDIMKYQLEQALLGKDRRFEWTLARLDALTFDAEISLSPTLINDTRMIQMVIHDISARKKAEAEIENWNRTLEQRVAERTKELEDAQDAMLNLVEDLNESKQDLERSGREIEAQKAYLEHLFKASPEGIALVETDGRVIRVNGEFLRLFGYSQDECAGRTLSELILPADLKDDFDRILQSITDGEGIFHETRRKKKDNSLVDVSITGVPIDIRSKQRDMFIIYRDISERKKAEKELEKARKAAEDASRAKGEFLANMSHEIRTPMNAIIGLTYLAMQTDLTDRQHDYLSKIDSSAQSLLGVINDILDFSKIEAGRLTMESVDFYLDDVLEKVADMTTMRADEKGLELVFEPDSDVPQELVGDPLRLGQILVNLVANAVKFTEKGDIVVRTKCVEKKADKTLVEFQVRDTGIGMDKEQMARLFTAFSQGDTSTTRKYGGTGLGLVICKRLVEMMGGDIGLESKAGRGSTFSFTASFGRHTKQRDNVRLFAQDFKGMRALIVDDSKTARRSLKHILESFQLKVDIAGSGREALALIRTIEQRGSAYDLVLTDWKMPLMDGIETARSIKTRNASSRIPVIIMVTAFGREEVLEKADEIGLDGFITKPASPSTLLDSIMQAFGDRAVSQGKKILQPARHGKGLDRIAGARILLAEDNDVNRQVATELLESVGLDVVCATTGREVLDLAAKESFDAILMDIQMPVMDGFETTRRLRAREKETEDKAVPIIALTAHAMAGDREKSLEQGMNDHLTKPLDPEALFASLVRWIEPRENVVLKRTIRPEKDTGTMDVAPLDLPGIDYAKALARVGGKKETYIRLSQTFIRNQERSPALIAEALAEGDLARAREVSHSLKGVSGNLGADALYQAAMDMELAIKKGTRETWDETLETLRHRLNEVLQVFRSIKPEKIPEKGIGNRNEKAIATDGPEILQALETLKTLIIEKSYRAGKHMQDLYTLSLAEEAKEELDTLFESIRAFDFSKALKRTDELLMRYNKANEE